VANEDDEEGKAAAAAAAAEAKAAAMAAEAAAAAVSESTTGVRTGANALWEDESERRFYELFPPLRETMPSALFAGAKARKRVLHTELLLDVEATEGGDGGDDDEGGGATDSSLEVDTSERNRAFFEAMLTVGSREACDALSTEFVYLNSKSMRRRVAQAVFDVPRTRLELIPHYARFLATLASAGLVEVPTAVLKMYLREFRGQQARMDQVHGLEFRIRNVRMLGECVKFRLAPTATAFAMTHRMLDSFSNRDIEVLSHFLETCGRYLVRREDSKARMMSLLASVRKKAVAKVLEPRLSMLLDNAYFMCLPLEGESRLAKRVRTPRPLEQQFTRHVLRHLLTGPESVERVVQVLRRLSWPVCGFDVASVLLAPAKLHADAIVSAAEVTAHLAVAHPTFGVALLDRGLERLETALSDLVQTRLQDVQALVTYIGALSRFRLVKEPLLAKVVDSILLMAFRLPGVGQRLNALMGGATEEQVRAIAATPNAAFFYIRLAALMLESACPLKRKSRALRRPLLHLRVLLWLAAPLPLEMEFTVADLCDALGWKLREFSSVQEAREAMVQDGSETVAEARAIADAAAAVIQARLDAVGSARKDSSTTSRTQDSGDGTAADVHGADDEDGDDGEADGDVDGEDVDDDEGDEDDVDEEEDDSDVDEVGEAEDAFDKDVKLKGKTQTLADKKDEEEDEAFGAMLAALTAVDTSTDKPRVNTKAIDDMAIPVGLGTRQRDRQAAVGADTPPTKRKLTLMVRRGGKAAGRDLLLDKEASLVRVTDAAIADAATQEDAADRDAVKQYVLAYSETHADMDADMDDERHRGRTKPAPRRPAPSVGHALATFTTVTTGTRPTGSDGKWR